MRSLAFLCLFPAICCGAFATVGAARGATLQFVGTHYDVGGTFFPGYNYPQNSIVPWRSDSAANIYATSSESPNRYYGTAGYALFGTRFDFPSANSFPGFAFNDPADDSIYPNMIDLPDFVSESQILATRKSGGWTYALIDDPSMQAGVRRWTFDGTNYPIPDGTNTTGVVPYVKLGVLDGPDILGTSPAGQPAGRWGFEVGEGAPAHFRIGVMTDGLDGAQHAPGEVFLYQVDGDVVGSGTLVRNRFVDMHFFDVIGAQPGDQFAIGAQVAEGGQNAGVAGFSFDIVSQSAGDADFNQDDVVDGNDFLVWQRGFGLTTGALLEQGDADGNGAVDGNDLAVWKQQFGVPGATGLSVAIPEPSALAILLIGVAPLARRRRR